jgi:hypothetical protein
MIGFCRHCNHFSLLLNKSKICLDCQSPANVRRKIIQPLDLDIISRGHCIVCDGTDLAKGDFFEGGSSGGGGASRSFSSDDSQLDSSAYVSTCDSGGDDSGSGSSSDSGGSDD